MQPMKKEKTFYKMHWLGENLLGLVILTVINVDLAMKQDPFTFRDKNWPI